MKRLATAIFALLLFGAIKLPFEKALMSEHRAAHFHSSELNLDLREQIGQGGFIAALSGFRSILADLVYIRAHIAWENVEWGRMKLFFDAATSLQPRATMFWEGASHHMAYNASHAAYDDPKQPREALRIKAQREYFKLGEQYLLRGIQYNPDRAALFNYLGLLYKDKFKDPCKASWAFAEAAKRPDALPYAKRIAVYQLSHCPGHEQEAYEKLKTLYHMGPDERLPTLLKRIEYLQDKLNIPPAERIDTTRDWEELR
ncbi:MAG: hypothetical protein EOP84_19140 [Verrucomicrobiaceae bacterium]|nr:MAG: hypothetical protein EOP84_19140 [Verrucomicrobiaceae bacterium]